MDKYLKIPDNIKQECPPPDGYEWQDGREGSKLANLGPAFNYENSNPVPPKKEDRFLAVFAPRDDDLVAVVVYAGVHPRLRKIENFCQAFDNLEDACHYAYHLLVMGVVEPYRQEYDRA